MDNSPIDKSPSEDEDIERIEIHGIVVERRGSTISIEAGPNFDREAVRKQFLEAGEISKTYIGQIVNRLLELLNEYDAIHLVGQVAFWATTGVAGIDDSEQRFGLEAQVEYLGGLALTVDEPRGELAGPDAVQECISHLSDLFEMSRQVIMAEELDNADPDPEVKARFVLRMEDLLARTQGYVPHLELVTRRLFEPIARQCVDSLGFSPSDIPVLLQGIREIAQDRYEAKEREARKIDPADLSDLEPGERGYAVMSWLAFGLVNPTGDYDAGALANATGIEEARVEAFLETFTSEWRSQTAFRIPGEPNTFRRRPGFRGDPGRYSIPVPWSILHEVIPWFKAEVELRNLDDLRSGFLLVRGSAVEAMVVDALAEVFGADRVHASVEYPIGGSDWAELDTLVLLGRHAIVVEAKSNALHDAYRRGDAKRVGYHVTDLITAPFAQAIRASSYLASGGTKFRYRDTQEEFEIRPLASTDCVAVSLERIDPLVLLESELQPTPSEPVWLVALPDLLAVCDVLDAPEALAAYIARRTAIAAHPDVRVFVEMDLLGAFLDDRLAKLLDTGDGGAGYSAFLGHHADSVNIYFTDLVAGLDPLKPAIRLSDEERSQLDNLYRNNDDDWHATALAVVNAQQSHKS